jgi:hypothetical protein
LPRSSKANTHDLFSLASCNLLVTQVLIFKAMKDPVRVLAVVNQGNPDIRFMLYEIFKNVDVRREAAIGAASMRRLFRPRPGPNEAR